MTKGRGSRACALAEDYSPEEGAEDVEKQCGLELDSLNDDCPIITDSTEEPSGDDDESLDYGKDPLLAIFFKNVRQYKLLTPEEERALTQKYQEQGDKEAFDRLVNCNLRLVVSIAKRYCRHGLGLIDLIQIGIEGLIRSLKTFDVNRARLSTYATPWIRQRITRALCDEGTTVRIPVHAMDSGKNIIRTSNQLEKLLGRKATDEEIAAELELSEQAVAKALRTMKLRTVYLDDLSREDDNRGFLETFPDQRSMSPSDDALAKNEFEVRLKGFNDFLAIVRAAFSDRDQRLFRSFYGLDSDLKKKTLDNVGQEFKISRERVRQLIKKIWLALPEHGFWPDKNWLIKEVFYLQELSDLSGIPLEKFA